MYNRRSFLSAALGAGGALGAASLLPAWARTASHGNLGLTTLSGTKFDLDVGEFPVMIGGRHGHAVGVNGTLPAPLIRFREGDEVSLNVTNRLAADPSIHWHGLLVPFHMDGVPGVSFPGIRPGETFQYKFAVPQSGTYWYHSHSGLQEQQGHYGPLIIDPMGADPVAYDREYVLVLSDWSFEHPHRIFEKLKASSETYNFNQRTLGDFAEDASQEGFGKALADRAMWGAMRMSPRDLADVTGATYTYLINGHSTADNWNGVFKPGEHVRLRIINASAMSIFNVRMPGLPMTVVASDGLNVQPVETDEFQIGVAEPYDVVVSPGDDKAYTLVGEAIDRSGMARATLAPRAGMAGEVPPLRKRPLADMKDMGMDMSSMPGMEGMDMSGGAMRGVDPTAEKNASARLATGAAAAMATMDNSAMAGMDHSGMDHGSMAGMDHGAMGADGQMAGMDHGGHAMGSMKMRDFSNAPQVKRDPSVQTISPMPVDRTGEPGQGLADVGHKVLVYRDLMALERNPDVRAPSRSIDIHLTGNMERFMWSFDGEKMSDHHEPINSDWAWVTP